ncbi:hypothetical protein BH09ACT10_BH09ACT10_13640 [soil metagenome]
MTLLSETLGIPTVRLKFMLAHSDGGAWGDDPTTDDGVVVLRSTEQTVDGAWAIRDPALRVLSDGEREATRLIEDDLLVTKSSGSARHIGKTTIVDAAVASLEPGFGNFMQRLRASAGTHPRYLWYLLNHSLVRSQFDEFSTTSTGLSNLNRTVIGSVEIPALPYAMQQQITDYLDRETAQIDILIEAQHQLVAMLRKRRAAVVRIAVAGSRKSGEATGNPWWTHLPNGWQVVPLRRVITSVADGPHFSPKYVEDGRMFISARNIKVDRWSLDDAKFVSAEDFAEFSKRVVPERGDVLYTKGGTTGVARAVDLDFPFQVWVHVAVLKVRHEIVDPYFLAYALNSSPCYDQSQLFTRGATNNDLGLTRMVNIELPLPPLKAQREIVILLDEQTAKIDTLIAEAERFIELSRERRSALITAAVTGQIDVKGEVA